MSVDANFEAAQALAKSMGTEELQRRFAEGIRLTRERLLELGVILVELESRGEKVEADRGLLNMLRRIGKGTLLVDVVVRFAGRPYNLASIRGKSLEEQESFLRMTDTEVDDVLGGNHKGKTRSVERQPRREEEGRQSSLASMVAGASAKDVADMCLQAVMAADDPEETADVLMELLHSFSARNGQNGKAERGASHAMAR